MFSPSLYIGYHNNNRFYNVFTKCHIHYLIVIMNDKFWIIVISLVLLIVYAVDYKLDKANSVEEDLLKTIKSRGYLIVGVKTDTRPFGYLENGKNVGFDVDIAKYIAKDILHDPNKIKFVQVTPSNRLYFLNVEKVDMVIATMTVSPERSAIINFSKPYFVAGQAVLVRSGSSIKTLADLNDKNVGVLYGSTAEKNIRMLMPSVNVLGYKTYNDAYNALKAGRIAAITSDDTILRHYALTDGSVKLLPKRYTRELYAIGVRKEPESKSLLKIVNINVINMVNDGTLTSLKRKWKLN